jgi:hypothetical protein
MVTPQEERKDEEAEPSEETATKQEVELTCHPVALHGLRL